MTDSQEKQLEERVHNVIVKALGIKAVDGAIPFGMGSTPGWDSMGHMTVVMEIEREFRTSFPSYRLPDLIDVTSILDAIREQQD